MPYNKEQLRAYWQTNKAILNQKRRQKRRLAKLGLATEQVSQIKQKEVSHQLNLANPEKANHGQPTPEMANPILTKLIKEWQTSTNYNCSPGCFADRYCNNCWYFEQNNLLDYKAGLYD